MKQIKRNLTLWVAMSVIFVGLMGCATVRPGPTISKENIKNITTSIPTDVRLQIEKLYSKDPVERGYGAHYLGVLGAEAVRAVPFLIGILDDSSPLKWVPFGSLWNRRDITIGNPTSPGEEAAKALIKITGQDFGRNSKNWQEWWEKEDFPYTVIPTLIHDAAALKLTASYRLHLFLLSIGKMNYNFFDDVRIKNANEATKIIQLKYGTDISSGSDDLSKKIKKMSSGTSPTHYVGIEILDVWTGIYNFSRAGNLPNILFKSGEIILSYSDPLTVNFSNNIECMIGVKEYIYKDGEWYRRRGEQIFSISTGKNEKIQK